MSRRTPLLVLLCLAVLAAPAQAATPFNAGTGNEPRIAVGADGVGHVTFAVTNSVFEADQIGYCRIPKGGSACDKALVLDYPDTGGDPPRGTRAVVFAPAPNKVVVASSCYVCGPSGAGDDVVSWVSTDNGASFDGGTIIGGFNPSADLAGTWVEASDLFVAISGDSLRAVVGGDAAIRHSTLSGSYAPEVEALGTDHLVTATNDLANIQYSVYEGPIGNATEVNDQGNWKGPFALTNPEGDNGESGLSSGPSGLYMHYWFFQAGNARVGLRRFDPVTDTFGDPRYLDADNPVDDGSLQYPDASQDRGGRVHAVWRTLYADQRLRYTVSDPTGTTFTEPGTLAAGEDFHDLQVAAGSDGKGWAVWSGNGSATLIRVVALEPVPETGIKEEPPPVVAEPVTFPAEQPTAKKKGKKVVVKVEGAITTPSSKSCAGTLSIVVKKRKKTLATKKVAVGGDCAYEARLKFKKKKLKKAKKVRVFLTFTPADTEQLEQTTRSYLIKVKK